jgi:hypothetical protein
MAKVADMNDVIQMPTTVTWPAAASGCLEPLLSHSFL